jgi:hypothetical protein
VKNKTPLVIAALVLLALVGYFAFRPHAADAADNHIKNPDLGTHGGATQVDTETH